jgi:hypothetical protein
MANCTARCSTEVALMRPRVLGLEMLAEGFPKLG